MSLGMVLARVIRCFLRVAAKVAVASAEAVAPVVVLAASLCWL
jgi:hypothetical protein